MEHQPLTYYVVWVPVLAALLGAIIGSVTSVVTMVVQARTERHRARLRLAVEAGMAEHRQAIEIAQRTPGSHRVAPLSGYIYYNAGLLELLDRGTITAEAVRELDRQQTVFLRAVTEAEANNGPDA
jgi:HAMP domain-containing protein